MSQHQLTICSNIIEESYGKLAEIITSHLLRRGGKSLGEMSTELHIDKSDIVNVLCVLMQHNLIHSTSPKSNVVVYQATPSDIIERLMYPHYIGIGREVGGSAAEDIMMDLITRGSSPMSQCIVRVEKKSANAFDETLLRKIWESFELLVKSRLIQRVTFLDEMNTIVDVPTSDRFLLPPHLKVSHIIDAKTQPADSELEPPTKKFKSSDETDEHILWYLNITHCRLCYRNQCILNAATEKFDPTATTIMRIITNSSNKSMHVDDPLHSATGPSICLSLIKDCIPHTLSLTDEELEQYCMVLTDEKFLNKTGDEGGGSYSINYKAVAELMCASVLESVVKERFDSKHLRLFRVLLIKKYMEQREILSQALIPHKEGNKMLYSLLAEQFISLQEIPTSGDFAPSKTFYLFSVQMPSIARVVLQRCYKALGNLMTRRKHEATENKSRICLRSRLEHGELQVTTSIKCLEDYLGFVTKA